MTCLLQNADRIAYLCLLPHSLPILFCHKCLESFYHHSLVQQASQCMHCLLAVCIGQYSPNKFPIVSPVLIPVDHWANNTDRWAERSRNSWMLWSNPSLQCLLCNFGPHWDIVNNIELGDSSKLVNICCMMGDRDGIRNLQAANVSHFTKFKGSSFLTDSYLRICQEVTSASGLFRSVLWSGLHGVARNGTNGSCSMHRHS